MKNIRPLRTEADYKWAMEEITRYFEKEPDVGSPDGDRFDVLATLIEAYEDEHYPISQPDPVKTIKAHMELFGLSQKALADILGSAPRASEILKKRRPLTLDMVHALNKEWRIPAEALIQPYHLTNTGKAKRGHGPRSIRKARA